MHDRRRTQPPPTHTVLDAFGIPPEEYRRTTAPSHPMPMKLAEPMPMKLAEPTRMNLTVDRNPSTEAFAFARWSIDAPQRHRIRRP